MHGPFVDRRPSGVIRPLSFFGWPHAAIFLGAWRDVGFRPVSVFVLVKNRMGLGYYSRAQHEQAFLLAKGDPQKPRCALSNVFSWKCSGTSFHPNPKRAEALSKLPRLAHHNSFVFDP